MIISLNLNNANNYQNYKAYHQQNFSKPTFTGARENIFFINNHIRINEMFKNKDSVFTREIESIPRRIYSGFIESQVYHAMSSKKEPLNQENVWTLFSPECFSRFLKENPDLARILDESHVGQVFKQYGLNIRFANICKQMKEDPNNDYLKGYIDFADALCRKYNIDILGQPKLYRFIGKSEVEALLRGEQIKSLNPYQRWIDVTTNPELNFGFSQYRVTFKPVGAFDPRGKEHTAESQIIEHDLDDYYFYLKKPYSISDIEKLEMGTPHGLLELNLEHKFSRNEIEAIDPLMFYSR